MDTQETIFYAYPIDEFHRTALTSDIIKAYESEDNQHRALPVLRLTAEELAYKINEDSFNDTDYWLTAVRPHRPSFDERIENLRNELIEHIISLMTDAGVTEVIFDEEWEEYTSVVWFDRHDFPYWSKVNRVGIYNEGVLQITPWQRIL